MPTLPDYPEVSQISRKINFWVFQCFTLEHTPNFSHNTKMPLILNFIVHTVQFLVAFYTFLIVEIINFVIAFMEAKVHGQCLINNIYLLGLALYEELGTSWWVNLPAQAETSSLIYLTQGVSISIDDWQNTLVILLKEVSYFSPQRKQ